MHPGELIRICFSSDRIAGRFENSSFHGVSHGNSIPIMLIILSYPLLIFDTHFPKSGCLDLEERLEVTHIYMWEHRTSCKVAVCDTDVLGVHDLRG